MWKKRLLLIAVVLICLCVGAYLLIVFYLRQHLYIRPTSDEELIDIMFDQDAPGYGEIKIMQSEGEGIRRLPREVLIQVELLTFPETLLCEAEIFYDIGDPMALNAQWRTHECIGHDRWISLTQLAYRYGLKENDCHQERITLLLAHWIQTGVIKTEDIFAPELRERVATLLEDSPGPVNGEYMDGGLFDLDEAVFHQLVGDEEVRYTAYVLRCDGTLDAYLLDGYGKTYSVVDIMPGDYVLPDTIY